ncbi:5-formyltetrahydrofolate cyclo-ligase [Salinigranum rubrum]|uniref:5-formyltetrahydrofolate cyclo-ligase n=1 Tax=Salinigranum rubrum TaxID=755307 RepID=A0A2I8VMJ9_9EURY|nr:5-formyltetrahydrofolate cyclo-ligase [Salinigranum rubrum]AUV83153.1 5-formyltetrahydrofolate cyclo-ligase [Salinigranum rubrum]
MDKQQLRERVWDELEKSGEARFPFPPHGRIPNFAGASEAADRLAATAAWRNAEVVKANPDAPQLPVRRAALHAGKRVYMAVPRLRDENPFLELDPDRIAPEERDAAATLSHVDDYAEQVGPDALPDVDLVVSGSVAVTESGTRIGKGEGYSDLEWAVLFELGRVDESTPVVTTVHERQVVDDAPEPDAHDVTMDLVVTPERVVETGAERKPTGIDWALASERIEEIPVLGRLAPEE